MSILNGSEVVSGVAVALTPYKALLGVSHIYKNTPKQGMTKPCVFIEQVNKAHINGLKNRGTWEYIIAIRVHPATSQTDIETWATKIETILLDSLQYITVSNQAVKAIEFSSRLVDNVLITTITYQFRVIRILDDEPIMETLNYGERMK